MTLGKLAGIAGVSVSTASKAFSGSNEISEATREMIFELARKYGCFDKYYKNKYESTVFAVIAPEINSEHYYKLIIAIQKHVEAVGGTLLISTSNFSSERTKELFRYYTEFCKVDGIIVIGRANLIENPENFPVVVIGENKVKGITRINYSCKSALNDAVELLVNNGHERIAFAGEALTVSKQELFVETMSKYGLYMRDEYLQCSEGSRFEQAGRECAKRLLQCKTMPTAIVCAYDYIALGVMEELNNNGIKVPEDVSIIGMDNINITSMHGISLTSISYNAEKLGECAINLLQKKMKNGYYSAIAKHRMDEDISIECELVIRDSVAQAKR